MFLLHPVKINILYKEGKIVELWIKIKFHFTYKITLRFGFQCLLHLKDFIWTEIQMKLEICTYSAVKKNNWLSLQHGKLSGKKKKQTRKEKGSSEWSVRSYFDMHGHYFCLSLKSFLQLYQDSPCVRTRLWDANTTLHVYCIYMWEAWT